MFVIFGAAGNVGKVTATVLRKAGQDVRAVVRSEKQGGPLAALGCEVRVADLHDTQAVARAIEGTYGVQIVCPVPRGDDDPAAAMRAMIDSSVAALRDAPPPRVLALSDYGAEHARGTGITTLFHYLETRLQTVDTQLTFLRAAEHMHNWGRTLPNMLASGVLHSLHQPLDKLFPTVAARDVGLLAAELLLDATPPQVSPRVVSIESDQRVNALDVARTIGELTDRRIVAREAPHEEWAAMLQAAGLGERHARLIIELCDAHNAGLIDVDSALSERRFGTTTLAEELAAILPRVTAATAAAAAAAAGDAR
ncbi:NAD(P)H-binding protein [Paraburkholderia sp. BCC1884]|uniref:NAD(P)H-binding protein n=1 Tax=Paraburkholderia sp. BCC1884 TaxID=2562668 RepID=UPI0011842DA6|nr:NAD(P)H-binding protein [Paraburkholderia sp. BCC1884]